MDIADDLSGVCVRVDAALFAFAPSILYSYCILWTWIYEFWPCSLNFRKPSFHLLSTAVPNAKSLVSRSPILCSSYVLMLMTFQNWPSANPKGAQRKVDKYRLATVIRVLWDTLSFLMQYLTMRLLSRSLHYHELCGDLKLRVCI